ncbi:MAG: right-handed parallel beta-helix repeat-containing protein, partial [Methanobrevibacter sp.]|nr:right-handed parallel beta-helix repeat-containing protein [Candidatus Methanovirga basalitermitum]
MKKFKYMIGFCFLSILLLVSAPVVNNDIGDSEMYTDGNDVLFNISAEPVRISDDSGYISVKIETNESVNKTFKLKFKNENSTSTIKLDNNMTSTLLSDDFSIKSKTNKILELTDNTTNESACNLSVLFEDKEIINYNNLIPKETNNPIIIKPGNSIQEAINNATLNDIDTIILENGEYNQYSIIVNKTNLTIKAADGANPIVNANHKGRVFDVTANNVTISGLTITGGNSGGVSIMSNGSVTNCSITNNIASGDGSVGGVYLNDGNVTGSTITNCNSVTGGGVYLNDGNVTGSTITNCTSTNDGGGVYLNDGNVTGSTITNCNSTNSGGGVYLNDGSVTGSTITNCNSTNSGGGVYLNDGNVTGSTITNCCTSWYGDSGGGVYLNDGSVTGSTITNCNSVTGGGVYLNDGSVTGSTITNCNSVTGGGVYLIG